MSFIWNFPCFSIVLCIFGGIISSALKGRAAKYLNAVILLAVAVMSACVLGYTLQTGESFTYVMGRFPAPWGNELRAGVLEGGMALFFSLIMILSLFAGREKLNEEVEPEKMNLYFIMINLLLSSLLALVYTNDLFTAYVFVEINTISACGLIMIRQTGRTIEAATRYMIMSLLGSGMLLMGLCMLYDMTGHLLMENIHDSVLAIVENGQYHVPLMVTIGMICVGLAIKSALFPFHTWLPDAYGYSTVASAAILSSLVSKGYIFLLIKIIYRVIGFDVIYGSRVTDILFVFGLAGMIMGSLSAIKENDIRRMIAFSSVAQIGYIYMGFGLGTQVGVVASIFHILSHAATKSLLFISASGLVDASGGSKKFIDLTGAAYRNKIAGVAFSVGALSMVGLPLFSGFISKLLFAQAAVRNSGKMLPTMIVLAISTILNAIYFMKTVIRIYTPVESDYPTVPLKEHKIFGIAMVCFIALNVFLGLWSDTVIGLIETGLAMFA
ncbi:MAG: complex I subunit 5 family protein [Lachnospiraceae bacterium]